MPTNRRVTLAARPDGVPQESDFAIDEVDVPRAGSGEVLVRMQYVSLDPYQRGRMSDTPSYAKPLEVGDVITSQSVGEVAQSNDGRFSVGDLVVGQLGWQQYAVARGGALRLVPPMLDPPTLALHAVGMTGLTAYFGLFDVGEPRAGDTVVVSGASGAVGQIAGQLAKLSGCRAVGIAGGPEKKRELTELYGYDVAIDYKNEDVAATLRGEDVHVYFDNVGGELSQAVHRRLALGARIVICGQVSQYNSARPQPSVHPGLLIVYRARMQGFLVFDYATRYEEAIPRLARWVATGELKWKEDVTEGLENAPRAFVGMLEGANRGKALVRVD